jgi:hypothetical protein
MSPKSDDLKMLICKYKNMKIEELEASIDYWKKNTDCSNQIQAIDIAKNELEVKYKERQEQVELLTKSLTSSSRVGRWISSIRSILKQSLESKN